MAILRVEEKRKIYVGISGNIKRRWKEECNNAFNKNSKYYIPIFDIVGVGFTINQKADSEFFTTKDFKPKPAEDAHRPKQIGINPIGTCLMQEENYDYRIKPFHLATVIGLRYLDIITSQQSKILVEKLWDNWCWENTFYYIEQLDLLAEIDGDLKAIVAKVLSDNIAAVNDFKSGKQAAFGRLMGNTMKAWQASRDQKIT